MESWHPLEFKIQKLLRDLPVKDKVIVVGLSGGADSTALLLALETLGSAMEFRLQAIHCHHGEQSNVEFRRQSADFCESLCQDMKIPLQIMINKDPTLKNEEDLRSFRLRSFSEVLSESNFLLALAHHEDDLLETRLLRLLRGTGPAGLQAMQPYKERVLRPLLETSRAEIEAYLAIKDQKFLSDPSADDLRSFVRQEWLPLLEQRQKGASKALARSLELLLSTGENLDLSRVFAGGSINLQQFLTLSRDQKAQVLALYFSSLEMRNYSQGIIREILKHLDKAQIVHNFQIAGLQWNIDAKNIRAVPLSKGDRIIE